MARAKGFLLKTSVLPLVLLLSPRNPAECVEKEESYSIRTIDVTNLGLFLWGNDGFLAADRSTQQKMAEDACMASIEVQSRINRPTGDLKKDGSTTRQIVIDLPRGRQLLENPRWKKVDSLDTAKELAATDVFAICSLDYFSEIVRYFGAWPTIGLDGARTEHWLESSRLQTALLTDRDVNLARIKPKGLHAGPRFEWSWEQGDEKNKLALKYSGGKLRRNHILAKFSRGKASVIRQTLTEPHDGIGEVSICNIHLGGLVNVADLNATFVLFDATNCEATPCDRQANVISITDSALSWEYSQWMDCDV